MISKPAMMLLAALSAWAVGGGARNAMAATDPYLWKYRPVLIFAPNAANADLVRQRAVVASRGELLRERDVAVVYVVGESVSAQFGPEPGIGAAGLRAKYGIAIGQFRAILVGKDGGVRLRSPSPLSADRLSSVIDGMPMRRDEMRDRSR